MADRGWEVVEDWGVEPDDHVVESAKNAPVDPRRFSLNKDPYYSGYDAVRDEDKKTRYSDVGQALKIGAINTAEAPAVIADYMTSGAIGSDARREAELTKRDLMADMTPQGRRASTAPFLAEEGQEGAFDVGMKDWLMMGAAQNAAPMAMSIFPAWMATGVAARLGAGVAAQGAIGAGVARGTSAAQNMADVTSSIFDEVDNLPDEKLKQIPAVQQYLEEGMDLSEARGRYRTEVAKHYPLLAAIVGAVGAAPEAEVVKTLAGASAKKGIKGAIGQIAGGAAEEFGEEGSGAALAEIAGSQAGLSDIDYHNIVSNALGGAAQGGVLHGPSALVHLGADNVAPDQKLALNTQSSKPASPEQTQSAARPEPVTSEVAAPSSAGEAIDDTMSAQLPPDVLASIDASLGPTARSGVGPAGQAILNQRQAPLPDELGDEIAQPSMDDEANDWEPVDDWGLNRVPSEPDPDLIRYDDGTTAEVNAPPLRTVEPPPPFKPGRPTGWMTPATEQAIRQAEANRAGNNDQEALDAYDDYRAERNTEPDVAYGVDEEPDQDIEYAPEEPSSSVQTEAAVPKISASYNPETKRLKLGDYQLGFNAKDAIDVFSPDGSSLNVYRSPANRKARRPLRSDEIYADEMSERNVPEPIQRIVNAHLAGEITPEQIVNYFQAPQSSEAPSSSVQTEAAPTSEVSEGAVKPKRTRRTKEQIAADNQAKETARAEKAAAREAAKTEKARLALEASQKRAAEKAARKTTKPKDNNTENNTAVAAVEPTPAPEPEEQPTPSGVLGPVYVGVAEKLATKTRVSDEGSHESKADRAKRATKKKVAEEEFFNSEHQPGDGEVYAGAKQSDLLRGDTVPKGTRLIRSDAQREALKARLQKFVGAVEKRSGPINPNVTKNSSDYELYARVAKDVLKYIDNGGERAQQALDDFVADEMAARKGDFKPMRKRRLEEGDQNSRPNNELKEETTSSASSALSQQFAPAPDEVDDHIAEQRKSDMRNAAREIIRRQIENTKKLDIGSLYIELASEYPDVIGQFKFRNLDEIKEALTDASLEKNTSEGKSSGAMKPKTPAKKAEQAPAPVRQISKEESDRYVQMLNETAKRDAERTTIRSTPKEEAPIWETGQRVSTAAAKNETLDARGKLAKATSSLGALRQEMKDLVASKNFGKAKALEGEIRSLERDVRTLERTLGVNPAAQGAGQDLFAAERRLSVGAAEGMSQDALRDTLLGGRYGDLISKLINDGNVVIHLSEDTLPGGTSKDGPVQAAVTPDGKIHLVANNLDAASANGVILHEAFHSSGQSLVGSPVWKSLLNQTGNIVTAVKNGRETNDFWVQAVRRAEAANTSPELLSEEVAAYAIENAENAPPSIRAFVARFIGAAKAWALKTFGVQFGKLTPEQLRSLAVAALRVRPAGAQTDTRYSLRADDVTAAVKGAPQAAKDQGQAVWNKVKRFATKGATLDQLRQVHAGLFVDQKGNDLLGKLVSTIQRMAPKAQKLREQSDALSQRFINLKKSNPEEADAFAQLAIDATMANVRLGSGANNDHLKRGGRNAQGKGRLADLQRAYAGLSSEAKQLYQDMAAYYRSMQNEMARNIVDNRLKQYDVNPKDRKAFIDRVIAGKMTLGDQLLFKDKEHAYERLKQVSQLRVVQGDYFPLMRNGRFIVTTNNKIKDLMGGTEIEPGKVEFRAKTDKEARRLAEEFAAEVDLPQTNWQRLPVSQANDFGYIVSVQTRGAHFFESEAQAIAWRREHAGEFDEVSEVSPIRETGLGSSDLTTAQLNSLQATVRNSNYSEEEKEAMIDMLQQGSAVLMSGNRIQKRGIARRKVLGASNDFGRNVVQYGEAVSNRLAQLEFRPEIDDTLKAMREVDKNLMDKNHPERTAVLNEITARIDSNVTAANEPGKFMKDLMTLTFLGKLASPMYSVINGMQPWMVTYPVLAGRYGPARAASMLTEAYGAIGFSDQTLAGIKNTYLAGKNFNDVAILNTTDVVESIRSKLKSQSDGAELNKVMDMLLERGAMSTAGFEMAQSIAQGRGAWGSTLAKVDRIARQLPQAVEDMNRAVSAIAAYRLARASMSEDKARDFAFTTVMNTQGDYSGVNAPRFFNNPVLRPAVQFKKYAQMMVYLLADMSHRAFSPNTPKEERKVALGQLTSVMGVQIAMAGALSLPGIEIAKLGFMVAGALGLGGGWDDEEEKLRKLADETFGKTWGELLTRGVVSRALNIDLSQRLSLADMATFGEPGDYERDGVDAYLWRMFAGAPYSTLNDMRQGVQDAVDGDFGKAAGRFFPVKIVSDAFKAANGYSEGKVYGYEAMMNIFGVKSARQAEQSRDTGNQIRGREQLDKTHKQLTDQYLKAPNAGERMKLRAKIIEFNKTAPLRQKVFPNALDKVRKRIEAERVS